jgi:hypothetical protein
MLLMMQATMSLPMYLTINFTRSEQLSVISGWRSVAVENRKSGAGTATRAAKSEGMMMREKRQSSERQIRDPVCPFVSFAALQEQHKLFNRFPDGNRVRRRKHARQRFTGGQAFVSVFRNRLQIVCDQNALLRRSPRPAIQDR